MERYRATRALRHLNDREWRVSLADIISSKDISFIYKRSYECDVLKVNALIRISLRIVVVLALSVYKKVSVELHCLTLFFEAILCERTPVSGGWLCQSLLIRVILLLERLSASNDLCK